MTKKAKGKARAGEKDKRSARCTEITPRLLRRLGLPRPEAEADKEARGRVLVIGGSPEMPGAAVLAATAAMRVGAGKLQIATCRSVAAHVGVAVPEARVFALPETQGGAVDAAGVDLIAGYVKEARAVLVGPGMCGEEAIARLTRRVVAELADAVLVLDADALNVLAEEPELLHRLGGRAVLTPHAEEMSQITRRAEEEIKGDTAGAARRAAEEFQAVVALKGRETLIAAPGTEEVYCNHAGNVGLATSGSGDTLAGLIAGLAARGATPLHAAAWGVFLHASAGDRLAERVGPLGYLARELLTEIPVALAKLERRRQG